MQEKVDIQPQLPLKNIHIRARGKLCFQYRFQGDLGAGPRDLYAAHAALDGKHANLVAGQSDVDLVPLPIRVALPRNQHPLVCERARRVFIRTKLWSSPTPFKLSLVVILLGKREEESLFAVRC